jgi:cytosine/adenosine deaminase-related metal-dependent hydrolase
MCALCPDDPGRSAVECRISPSTRAKATRRLVLKGGAGAAAAVASPAAFAQTAPAPDGDADLARLQGGRRVLFKGGVVLTMDRGVGDFAVGDVLVEDGKIRAVARDIPASAESTTIVDATNRIVMPGFVDTHHHFYQGLLRSILTNGLLNPDYNATINGPITAAYKPADVYAGSLITAWGMMEMGTTLSVDTSQCSHTPEHNDAGIKALQESGMRVVYAYWGGVGEGVRFPQDSARLRKSYFSGEDQLLTLALASTLDPKLFAYGRENGLRMVSHGVDKAREPRLHDLAKAGLLRAGDELIHCNDLSDAAWKIMKDAGVVVSLATPIEMTMGHGMPGIQGALDHGIRPSLSSDVDATMAQDPFTLMRSTMTIQRALALKAARDGEPNPPRLLTCRDVLEFATIEGARCAGLDGKTGSLTPGKEADIVVLRADMLNIWPLNNAPGAVVNVMNPGHVESVFVAGKVKKWRGRMVGVDTARVLKAAAEARDGVLARSGFKIDLLG